MFRLAVVTNGVCAIPASVDRRTVRRSSNFFILQLYLLVLHCKISRHTSSVSNIQNVIVIDTSCRANKAATLQGL